MAADLEEMKALLISLQPQQAQGVSVHAHTPPAWQSVRSLSPPQLSPVTEARSLDVLSIQASESMDCGDSEAHDSASQAASQASSHGTATALETGRSSIQPALKAALARLGLDTPPVAQPQQSAFFRGSTQPPTLEVPPSAPFIEELQRCWADPSRLSHLPSDCRALAAMQDASSYGLQRMPSIEPSVAALVLSPNEALRPDARCPRAQCRVTDDLIVRSYDTAARMGRIGNAMSHLMLALAQTLQGPHAASQELCEAALQAFAYSSRELGRLMSYLTIARRQIWLAQSPLAEADRRVLRSLPVLPGELFGQAAQQALDRSAQVVQARQQYAGIRQVYRRSNTAATSRGPTTAPAPPPPPPPRTRTWQESRRAEDFRRPTTTRTRRAAPYGQPAPRHPPDERRGRSGRRRRPHTGGRPLLQPPAATLGSADPRPLGVGNPHRWLSHPVQTSTAELPRGQKHHHGQPGEGSRSPARGQHPPGERGNLQSRRAATARWVLLHLFPNSQKGRRYTPYSRPEVSERVPEGSEVSYAPYHGRTTPHPGRRLVHHGRPEGRLLPCANCTTPQTVPEVCLRGPGIRVPGPTFWYCTSAPGVHQVCCSSIGSAAGEGHACPALPGRLAGMLWVGGPGTHRCRHSARTCCRIGAQSKPQKELTSTQAGDHLPWHAPGFKVTEGYSFPAQGRQHLPAAWPLQAGQVTHPEDVSAVTGYAHGSLLLDPAGSPGAASASEVDERPPPPPGSARAQTGEGHSHLLQAPPSLEEDGVPHAGCSSSCCPFPERGNRHRFLPGRMGCSLEMSDGQGLLDFTAAAATHQCVGAAGCAPRSAALPFGTGWQTCLGANRQFHCGVLHQPPGGHQVPSVPESGRPTVAMGPSTSSQLAGHVFTGRGQQSSRPAVPPGARPRRVEDSPSGGPRHLGPLWQGRCGPLCLPGVDTLPSLVQSPWTQHPGPGRTVACLAETIALRIPPSATDRAGSAQDCAGPPQAAAGRSTVAGASVVPQVDAAAGRGPLVPASEGRPAVTAGGADLAPRSSPAPALGLAAEGPDPLLELCEPAVVNTITNSRAPSTNALYANRWKLFSDWCLTQGEEPKRCPLPTILLFLQSLFDRGLTPSTIKVYAAAISAQHARVEGRTVGSHPLVARFFLKGALRLRPSRRSRVPTWNLPLVLQALCNAPFEPLSTTDISWLSLKTAFLLAITSARRVGELHALSVSADCLQWHPGDSGVTLWPNPSFLPKTLSSTFVNQPLSLAAFEAGQGEGSVLLCPVRALKLYVSRTESFRKCDALFLCHTGPRKGLALSKQRLSKWIVDAILHAYKRSGSQIPEAVRAHSTRSVATSWASLKGVPLSDICSAASWASSCTFTRFYRLNVVPHNPVATAVVPGPSQQH